MKKVVRLTESDLVRLVKRIIKEQPYNWGRNSINTPGSLRNYIEGPGTIGHRDYDPDAKMERQKRDAEEREKRRYDISFINPKTGREWNDEDSLRNYVENKFFITLPDDIFEDGIRQAVLKAQNYVKNYYK
jgi:hypothetical protein